MDGHEHCSGDNRPPQDPHANVRYWQAAEARASGWRELILARVALGTGLAAIGDPESAVVKLEGALVVAMQHGLETSGIISALLQRSRALLL